MVTGSRMATLTRSTRSWSGSDDCCCPCPLLPAVSSFCLLIHRSICHLKPHRERYRSHRTTSRKKRRKKKMFPHKHKYTQSPRKREKALLFSPQKNSSSAPPVTPDAECNHNNSAKIPYETRDDQVLPLFPPPQLLPSDKRGPDVRHSEDCDVGTRGSDARLLIPHVTRVLSPHSLSPHTHVHAFNSHDPHRHVHHRHHMQDKLSHVGVRR